MLGSISECLKHPLHYTTFQVLGENLPNRRIYDSELLTTIYTLALSTIHVACMAITVPFWCIGEFFEILSGKALEENDARLVTTPLASLSLHPSSSMGISISTYQNTSNPRFCAHSNWGRFSERHFVGNRANLGPGGGLDILTDEGLNTLTQLVRDAGGTHIRFSVEWTDIMMASGRFNDAAMQRYVHAAEIMRSRGIEPEITLEHFVDPLDANGNNIFESQESIDRFVTYATYVQSKFGHLVNRYYTFNEPLVNATENNIRGVFPAGRIVNIWQYERTVRNMLEAHRQAYAALHRRDPNIVVGMTHQAIRMVPNSRWNIIARIACFIMTYFYHESWMRRAERGEVPLDIAGLQVYTRPLIGREGLNIVTTTHHPNETMVAGMFRFDPNSVYYALREMRRRLPHTRLVVTETGTAGESNVHAIGSMDERRATFVEGACRGIATAQNEFRNIEGIRFWTIAPNQEWQHGYDPRYNFGLCARSRETRQIRPTRGYYAMQTIFRNTLDARAAIAQREQQQIVA